MTDNPTQDASDERVRDCIYHGTKHLNGKSTSTCHPSCNGRQPLSRSSASQPIASDERECCPTCGGPCQTEVFMRGGDHGWGATDKERTIYKALRTTASPAVATVSDEEAVKLIDGLHRRDYCASGETIVAALKSANAFTPQVAPTDLIAEQYKAIGHVNIPTREKMGLSDTAPQVAGDGFTYDKIESPFVFLQWKGTDACFDFHCKCGAHCHFDGYFAYYVKCPHCETHYQMPFNLFPREVTKEEAEKHCLVVLEADEDSTLTRKGSNDENGN